MNAPSHKSWIEQVDSYVAYRRAYGYALKMEESQLKSFARFAESQSNNAHLTLALAMRWARNSQKPSPLSWSRRIEVLRGFARFCLRTDPKTEIPQRDLFGNAHRRLVPHIYTHTELVALLDASARLAPHDGLRSLNCRTILGLLASTGLRIGEALALSRSDVDLEKGVLTIRESKFHKHRFVPLHQSTTIALRDYAKRRDQLMTCPSCDSFFLRDEGRSVDQRAVLYALRCLCRALGWQPRGDYPHHRLHDIRHTFIVRSLLRSHAQGSDAHHTLLALSTYVGHAKVSDTYWYLTGIPELMALAAQRFHHYAMGGPR